jgi:hypothetical protein
MFCKVWADTVSAEREYERLLGPLLAQATGYSRALLRDRSKNWGQSRFNCGAASERKPIGFKSRLRPFSHADRL